MGEPSPVLERDPPFPQPGRWFVSVAEAGRLLSRSGQPVYIAAGAYACDAHGPLWPQSEYREELPAVRLARGDVTSVAAIRYGELGDVIACAAAMLLVRRAYPFLKEVGVFCAPHYAAAIKMDGIFVLPAKPRELPNRIIVDFDHLLELDHSAPNDPKCVRVSRLEKMASVFGIYCDPASLA